MKYKYLYTNQPKRKNFWLVVIFVFLGLFMIYSFIRPADTGVLGIKINDILYKFLGIGRFFIPLILFYWVWYNLKSKKQKLKTEIIYSIILFILVPGIIKLFTDILRLDSRFAGWLGKNVLDIFYRIFGPIFGGIGITILFLYILSEMLGISILEMLTNAYANFVLDIQNWYKTISSKKKSKVEVDKPVSRYSEREKAISQVEEVEIKEKPKISLDKISSSTEKVKIDKEEHKKEEKVSILPQKSEYIFPSIDLLTLEENKSKFSLDLNLQAELLEKVLKEFNILAKVVNIFSGPVVTMYELELEPGIKVQSVVSLRDNIALGMKSSGIRIIAPLPGRGTIGIEIPNPKSRIVKLREILESEEYTQFVKDAKLPIAVGKTVEGKPYVTDIVPMPHLLIAGATGSGKSVCVHSIIISLLYKCSPYELKFLLIDPKRLELTIYNGIPHLYDPDENPSDVKVITSSKEAAKSLSMLIKVMEQRYEKFAHAGVRNIEGYNELMVKKGLQKEYYIVVIIDEFADLILTEPKGVEESIQRLAQMSRAVGIHLVLATQRPSVDVITGVIKANFSSRIAFQVLSKTDSRVILDVTGAEELLGSGDMLFLPTGAAKPVRLQGAYVSEKEVSSIVDFIKSQGIKPEYTPLSHTGKTSAGMPTEQREKELKQKEDFYKALILIKERHRVSQDLLKAHFGSSSKATDLLSLLEIKGFIYKPEGTNRWKINFDKIEEELKNYTQELEKI